MPNNFEPSSLITFSSLAGVPIHYARAPVAEYGTIGVGPRHCRLTAKFKKQVETCLEVLWNKCPLGRAEVIVSAGCYVDKPGTHGLGRAIDIDSIWWKDAKPLITKQCAQDFVRYLTVEAVLRFHFGVVLDFWYPHHQDHWHCDDSVPVFQVLFSPSRIMFTQAVLTHIFKIDTKIDGLLGSQTSAGIKKIIGREWQAHDCWKNLLKMTMEVGFTSQEWQSK